MLQDGARPCKGAAEELCWIGNLPVHVMPLPESAVHMQRSARYIGDAVCSNSFVKVLLTEVAKCTGGIAEYLEALSRVVSNGCLIGGRQPLPFQSCYRQPDLLMIGINLLQRFQILGRRLLAVQKIPVHLHHG